jgi:hypothetical protein
VSDLERELLSISVNDRGGVVAVSIDPERCSNCGSTDAVRGWDDFHGELMHLVRRCPRCRLVELLGRYSTRRALCAAEPDLKRDLLLP